MKPKKPWLGLLLAGVSVLLVVGSVVADFIGVMHMQMNTENQSQERDRNVDRTSDIHQIGSLLLHNIDDPGFLEQIPDSNVEICRYKNPNCLGLIDLATLIDWDEIPYDKHSATGNGTGYAIHKNKLDNPAFGGTKTHTITLTALHAEGGEELFSTY